MKIKKKKSLRLLYTAQKLHSFEKYLEYSACSKFFINLEKLKNFYTKKNNNINIQTKIIKNNLSNIFSQPKKRNNKNHSIQIQNSRTIRKYIEFRTTIIMLNNHNKKCLKKTLSFLLFLLTVENLVCDYQNFANQYGRDRQAMGEIEWKERKAVFEARCSQLLYITEYEVEVNNFTDWTEEYLQGYLNLKIDQRPNEVMSTNVLRSMRSVDLPISLDYRALGKVTSSKSQGSCGSCWAFVAAALIQSKFLIEEGHGYDFSEQYLLQCSGKGSCDGGYTLLAVDFARKTGMPEQKQMPYIDEINGIPINECKNIQKIKFQGYPVPKTSYYTSDQQLKFLLYLHGPISVAINARNSFLSYKSGIYNGCPQSGEQSSVNHGLLLVGYDQSGNWIVKNSWGRSWGQNGFGVISRERNCGINYYAEYLEMTDGRTQIHFNLFSWNDRGWQGTVMEVKQENVSIIQIGQQFDNGGYLRIENITILMGVPFKVVLVAVGENIGDISLKIYDDQGFRIFQFFPKEGLEEGDIVFEGCIDCEFDGYKQASATKQDEKISLFLYILGSTTAFFFLVILSLLIVLFDLRKKLTKVKDIQPTGQDLSNNINRESEKNIQYEASQNSVARQKQILEQDSSLEYMKKQNKVQEEEISQNYAYGRQKMNEEIYKNDIIQE